MILKNANVFQTKGAFEVKDVAFTSVFGEATKDDASMDCKGMYLIPGMVDVHIHGAMSWDTCDASAQGLDAISKFLVTRGVTSFCPTTMTYDEETLTKIMKNIGDFPDGNGARVVGINMEGPFICSAKKGAQAGENICPANVDTFQRLQKASGNLIRLVDIAPEEEGAMAFIDQIHESCAVSLAHTSCDYDTAMEAFDRGANHVTHLFNAMKPLGHRDPAIIGAAADKGAYVEVICDGIHLHPSVIRAVFKLYGKEKICFISDSIRCAGLTDGEYELGGQPVSVNNGKATLKDGTIAGSSIDLLTALTRGVEFGVSLESVVESLTMTPAKSIGMFDTIGSIDDGKQADCVLLSETLEIVKVFKNGVCVYSATDAVS